MTLREELKILIKKEGLTMTEIVQEINNRHGKKTTLQNFSKRLSQEMLKYKEVEEVLSILDYSIHWVKNS